jgi:hypothetical protein
MFSEAEITAALNAALTPYGLVAFSAARQRQVQLAILSMLQGVPMLGRGKQQFGTLELRSSIVGSTGAFEPRPGKR